MITVSGRTILTVSIIILITLGGGLFAGYKYGQIDQEYSSTLIAAKNGSDSMKNLVTTLRDNMTSLKAQMTQLQEEIRILEENSHTHSTTTVNILWWGFDDYASGNAPFSVEYLKGLGYNVIHKNSTNATELTSAYLSNFNLIVSASNHRMSTTDENQAIRSFVANGGSLILMCDSEFSRGGGPEDELAALFGFHFTDDTSYEVTAAIGQSSNPIWSTIAPKTSLSAIWDGYIADGYSGTLLGVSGSIPAIVKVDYVKGRVLGIGYQAFQDFLFSSTNLKAFFDYLIP